MARNEITVDDRQLDLFLAELGGRLNNPFGMLTVLGEELAKYETRVFSSRNRGRWRPLSPATLRQKSGRKILRDTGHLLRDFQDYDIDLVSESVAVGSDEDYATYVSKRRTPAPRPTDQQVRAWQNRLARHLLPTI